MGISRRKSECIGDAPLWDMLYITKVVLRVLATSLRHCAVARHTAGSERLSTLAYCSLGYCVWTGFYYHVCTTFGVYVLVQPSLLFRPLGGIVLGTNGFLAMLLTIM